MISLSAACVCSCCRWSDFGVIPAANGKVVGCWLSAPGAPADVMLHVFCVVLCLWNSSVWSLVSCKLPSVVTRLWGVAPSHTCCCFQVPTDASAGTRQDNEGCGDGSTLLQHGCINHGVFCMIVAGRSTCMSVTACCGDRSRKSSMHCCQMPGFALSP